jgi:hypothetical protein
VAEQRPFKPLVVGSTPTAPTNISFAGKSLQGPREQLGNTDRSTCCCRHGKHHSNYFAVCVSQRLGDCLGVGVLRPKANIRSLFTEPPIALPRLRAVSSFPQRWRTKISNYNNARSLAQAKKGYQGALPSQVGAAFHSRCRLPVDDIVR